MSTLDLRLFHESGYQKALVPESLKLVSSREGLHEYRTDYPGEHE